MGRWGNPGEAFLGDFTFLPGGRVLLYRGPFRRTGGYVLTAAFVVFPAAIGTGFGRVTGFLVFLPPGAVRVHVNSFLHVLVVGGIIPRAVGMQGGFLPVLFVLPVPGAVGVSGHDCAVGLIVCPRAVLINGCTFEGVFHG